MLPVRLDSGVLHHTSLDRMFPSTLDIADRKQDRARDHWVKQQIEEAMRHRPADLEVLPSPLLLKQMEREAVQRRSPPASLVSHPDLAAKPSSSSRHKKRWRGMTSCGSVGEEVGPMLADVRGAASNPASSSATALSPRLVAALPMPYSLAPAQVSVATPDELEEWLRFFACQIKSFRRISLCIPLLRLRPSLQSAAAAEQPTPGIQSAPPAAQSSAGLQNKAAAQPTPCLQNKAAAQPTPCLQNKAAAQSTLCLQSAAIVLPKSASTSSTPHRGRRKRDASAPPQATEGLPLLKPPRVWPTPLAPAPATEGPGNASAPAPVIEGPGNASASVPGLKVFQGFTERLVLLLISETQDEVIKDEPPPDPVPEWYEKEFVLTSESGDKGFEDEPPLDPVFAFEGPVGTASAYEGSPGSASAYEGSPGSASASEGSAGSASASEGSPRSALASEGLPGSASASVCHRASPGLTAFMPLGASPRALLQPLRHRQALLQPLRHRQALLQPLRHRQALLQPLRDHQTEGPLLCSADHQTVTSFVAGLLHSCSVTTGFLTNLQVPAVAGLLHSCLVTAGFLTNLQVPADAGLYVSAGLVFAAVGSRHGLYISAGPHVFSASHQGLYASFGFQAIAADRPGHCVAGPTARLNCVPAWDDLLVARLTVVPAWGDVVVARLTSVPARSNVLVAQLTFVTALGDVLLTHLNFVIGCVGKTC
ncbi:hypothetical protein CRENBAI_026100 [Crenichthys baileyi]|uniref:Uncharacterized protein n=1 Tax=Crenichthys baileyi TaxID=28760 RepID=A0AAV9SML8_9TELE